MDNRRLAVAIALVTVFAVASTAITSIAIAPDLAPKRPPFPKIDEYSFVFIAFCVGILRPIFGVYGLVFKGREFTGALAIVGAVLLAGFSFLLNLTAIGMIMQPPDQMKGIYFLPILTSTLLAEIVSTFGLAAAVAVHPPWRRFFLADPGVGAQ